MRAAGKREMGQMTIFDLVLLLLIANAVQNAMVGPDTSLVGGDLGDAGAAGAECAGGPFGPALAAAAPGD